jgi:hypothetical protein
MGIMNFPSHKLERAFACPSQPSLFFRDYLSNMPTFITRGERNTRHSISQAGAKLDDGVIEGLLTDGREGSQKGHGLLLLLQREPISATRIAASSGPSRPA